MVKVTINPASLSQFNAALVKYAQRSKQTLRDVTLEQAALACQDAATFTPPVIKAGGDGLGNAAKKAGERAIELDINKVIEPLKGGGPKVQASRVIKRLGLIASNGNSELFWKLVAKHQSLIIGTNPFVERMLSPEAKNYGTEAGFRKAGNYFRSIGRRVGGDIVNRAYLDSPQQVMDIFEPYLKRQGGRFWKKGKYVTGIKRGGKYIAENKGDIDLAMQLRQLQVGSIKSGWSKALQSLPKPMINGVPKNFGVSLLKVGFINRHSGVPGNSSVAATDKVAEVTVRNLNGNVNNIADDAGVLGLVYGNRVKQIGPRTRKLLQDDINTFNKK